MKIFNKEEFEQVEHSMLTELKKEVFIYPTDSIYGIGCDATNSELVNKVRELKNSNTQPFSVIIPNKEWIVENCEIPPHAEEWIEKLGSLAVIDDEEKAISLILKLKNKDAVASNVLQGFDSISVRMPDHWFTSFVGKLQVPIVTTSANPTGGNFMTKIENLHERVKAGVKYCIYEGEKHGSPSTLINLASMSEKDVAIKKR